MRILYVTTVGITMGFFKSFIKQLIDEGHTVEIATNETESKVADCYYEWNCSIHHIDCSRSPLNKGNFRAIGQIRSLVEKNQYDIVHCHTPIAAMCTRIACRKLRNKGIKVFYTAHGFHFYKGAPLKNWLIYYPIEKICSRWTDVLITINQEDYVLAQRKLKAKQVEYVPGVGIDVAWFRDAKIDKIAKRMELGIPHDAFLLASVGELNTNKNHQIIIRAMSKLDRSDVHYIIAGMGESKERLISLAEELGISDRVHLLGYRTDVNEIYKASDVCCFVSLREGLGLAAIEGMASGLPLITTDIRGINDYSLDGITGFKCSADDIDGFSKAISTLVLSHELRFQMGQQNKEVAARYDVSVINRTMKNLYDSIYVHSIN